MESLPRTRLDTRAAVLVVRLPAGPQQHDPDHPVAGEGVGEHDDTVPGLEDVKGQERAGKQHDVREREDRDFGREHGAAVPIVSHGRRAVQQSPGARRRRSCRVCGRYRPACTRRLPPSGRWCSLTVAAPPWRRRTRFPPSIAGLAEGADGLELDVHSLPRRGRGPCDDDLLDRTTNAIGPIGGGRAAELGRARRDRTRRPSRSSCRAYPPAGGAAPLPGRAADCRIEDGEPCAGARGRRRGSRRRRRRARVSRIVAAGEPCALCARTSRCIPTGAARLEIGYALYCSWVSRVPPVPAYRVLQVPEVRRPHPGGVAALRGSRTPAGAGRAGLGRRCGGRHAAAPGLGRRRPDRRSSGHRGRCGPRERAAAAAPARNPTPVWHAPDRSAAWLRGLVHARQGSSSSGSILSLEAGFRRSCVAANHTTPAATTMIRARRTRVTASARFSAGHWAIRSMSARPSSSASRREPAGSTTPASPPAPHPAG